MKCKDLIEMLQKINEPESEVVFFNADVAETLPVTGATYGGKDEKIELFNDEP